MVDPSHSLKLLVYRHKRGHIQKRNHTDVMDVSSHSLKIVVYWNTREQIQKRNHTHVMVDTREHIQK